MRNQREDPGQTSTAAAAASAATDDLAEPPGATLGRYRIERELGAGAMGVVHAAFDPDLERRVALKVLRSAAAPREARERLLREARAMARLTHPNVVTVHEVGTAGGRDFIAMELIQGETLAQWLRAASRPSAAVLDAFLAAGCGLAAAHAAGIVHRDFKPHNVLRSREGRIVVTDFGLAREADGALSLDTTLPPGAALVEPTPLVGITVTGSLLGTPAYMAPEQWQGGAVTPATDQFAYCVALWEALAGERPYHGPTLDDLRRQIAAGPAVLDASRIPRRVRRLLCRGLDPDPERRWPSMDALHARLLRARQVRRPGILIGRVGVLVAVSVAVIFALLAWRNGPTSAIACVPPERDVQTIWSPAIAAELRAGASDTHAGVLDAAFRNWQTARAAACAAPAKVRQAQLRCLDRVLDRFDVLRRAFARVPGAAAEQIQAQLIDPGVCRKPTVEEIPRLTLAPSSEVIAAYALLARSSMETRPEDREITALTDAPGVEPCARILATLAFASSSEDVPHIRERMTRALDMADQCGDERLRADLLIEDSPYHWELPVMGPRGEAAIERAENAAGRVMQPDLAAVLAGQRSVVNSRRGRWDEAFRLVETELAGYRARGLQVQQVRAVIARNVLRLGRAEPHDVAAVAGDVQTWRPIAVANHTPELARQLDVLAALARFERGDVAAAHAEMIRLMQAQPRAGWPTGSRRITGKVVDRRGRPVAGARVVAGNGLTADSSGIGLPAFVSYNHFRDYGLRITTSDDTGHFVIEGAAPAVVIAAQLGDRCSRPIASADRATLILEPTRRVSGKVDLGDSPYTRALIYGVPAGNLGGGFRLIAPVAPDGSFTLAGAPTTALQIGVTLREAGEFDGHVGLETVPASPAPVTGLTLRVTPSNRTIDVVVRSTIATSIDGAYVELVAGKHSIATPDDFTRLKTTDLQLHLAMPVIGNDVPGPVLGQVQPGDLVAHFEHAWPGDLTVCAGSYAGDLMDPAARQRSQARFPRLAIKCRWVEPTETVVLLEVPPQPHL